MMVHIVMLTSVPGMARVALEKVRDTTDPDQVRTHVGFFDVVLEEAMELRGLMATWSFVKAADVGPFNYAAMNNRVARGIEPMLTAMRKPSRAGYPLEWDVARDWLLFLNDDVGVRPMWLDAMLECAEETGAAAVGMKLVYPEGHKHEFLIQHAGLDPGPFLLGSHRGLFAPMHSREFADPAYRRVWAVTGACMLVRAVDFRSVAGFDEGYEHVSQDVDLCMKLRVYDRVGLTGGGNRLCAVVQSTWCWHAEGATRGERMDQPSVFEEDGERFREKWAGRAPELAV